MADADGDAVMTEAEAAPPAPPPPAPPDGGQLQASLPLHEPRAGQATGKRTKKWVATLQPDTCRPAHCNRCKDAFK
eukprot:1743302-Lingulodinium_polyedra.AAC.1